MLANWITLSRLPLLLICILILYLGSRPVLLGGVMLRFVGLMLDTVGGMVARKTGRTSLFGSVLDIAAGRAYELVLWVCFAPRLPPSAGSRSRGRCPGRPSLPSAAGRRRRRRASGYWPGLPSSSVCCEV